MRGGPLPVRWAPSTTLAAAAAVILLRHDFSARAWCCDGAATRASYDRFAEGPAQPHVHGCDRVRDVAFRPQGQILWVDNCRVREGPGLAWRNEVLRGESSPVRR